MQRTNPILILDDDPSNTMVLSSILTDAGYRVRFEVESASALAGVVSDPPSIIFMDVEMKGMDGYEVCRRLKADASTSHIPVIFLGARDEESVKVRGYQVGAVDYLMKPFRAEEILARINTHLSGQHIGLIGVSPDISERDRAEERLQLSEQHFRLIWEKSADGMRLTNHAGMIVNVNDAFCRMTEMSRSDLEGQIFGITYAENSRDHVVRVHKERFRSRTVSASLEREMTLWNGKHVWMEVSNSFLDDGEEPLLLSIFRDKTERRDIEIELKTSREIVFRKNEELARTISALRQLQDGLLQSEKMASIGQLTAGIAHEINNPLAFIASNLNRFSEYFDEVCASEQFWRTCRTRSTAYTAAEAGAGVAHQLPYDANDIEFVMDDFKQLMGHTIGGVERIKRIVEQLRGFSHLSGRECADADINKALDDTLIITSNELKYTVTVIKEYGVMPLVRCNIGELKQVFINLLVNAAHAIKESGNVTIRTAAQEEEVVIDVIDDGCGIPADHRSKIFDPFFTTKPVGKGTGLGLWISATIIHRHEGSITVESEEGKGTTFSIRLPLNHTVRGGGVQ